MGKGQSYAAFGYGLGFHHLQIIYNLKTKTTCEVFFVFLLFQFPYM